MFSYKYSNSGRNDSTPQTQSNVGWISSKVDLEISFMKTRSEMWVLERGRKSNPATGVRNIKIERRNATRNFNRNQETAARSVENETRNAELNVIQNPELWGDFSQLQIQIKQKSQLESVPQDTSEFKSNQNFNSTLYREIPRNLIFSI